MNIRIVLKLILDITKKSAINGAIRFKKGAQSHNLKRTLDILELMMNSIKQRVLGVLKSSFFKVLVRGGA